MKKLTLNTPIKARWALRTLLLGLVIGFAVWGGRTAGPVIAELDERQQIEASLIEYHDITRGFENNAYGTYWNHCNVWVTAGHVHSETLGATPPPVARDATASIEIDAAFYGGPWLCHEPPAEMRDGQEVWIAGYPGGSDKLAMRRGEVYIKRSVSGSDGYSAPTWIVVFPKNNIAAWLSEPVAGGMSGGIVIDAETEEPVGILVTQNSPTTLAPFGDQPVHSADVVSLIDAHSILLNSGD